MEWQVLGFGHVAEIPVNRIPQPSEWDFLNLDGDGAGFELRQIENVIDEMKKVGARGVNIPAELNLFLYERT